jgi:hypothetical protein
MEDNKYIFLNLFYFNKDAFRVIINVALDKNAPECRPRRFSDQEFDACIDYYEKRD